MSNDNFYTSSTAFKINVFHFGIAFPKKNAAETKDVMSNFVDNQ